MTITMAPAKKHSFWSNIGGTFEVYRASPGNRAVAFGDFLWTGTPAAGKTITAILPMELTDGSGKKMLTERQFFVVRYLPPK